MNPKICLVALSLCSVSAYAQSATQPSSLPQTLTVTPQWEKEISAAALKFTGQPCIGEYTAEKVAGSFSAAQFAEAAAGAKAFTEDFRAFLPQTRVLFDTDSDKLTRFALLDTALPLFSQQERRSDGVYTLGCTVGAAAVAPATPGAIRSTPPQN